MKENKFWMVIDITARTADKGSPSGIMPLLEGRHLLLIDGLEKTIIDLMALMLINDAWVAPEEMSVGISHNPALPGLTLTANITAELIEFREWLDENMDSIMNLLGMVFQEHLENVKLASRIRVIRHGDEFHQENFVIEVDGHETDLDVIDQVTKKVTTSMVEWAISKACPDWLGGQGLDVEYNAEMGRHTFTFKCSPDWRLQRPMNTLFEYLTDWDFRSWMTAQIRDELAQRGVDVTMVDIIVLGEGDVSDELVDWSPDTIGVNHNDIKLPQFLRQLEEKGIFAYPKKINGELVFVTANKHEILLALHCRKHAFQQKCGEE